MPNAYTAAITDYMRRPLLTAADAQSESKSVIVGKSDFPLDKVEVVKENDNGVLEVVSLATPINYWQWRVTMKDDEVLRIRDGVGNHFYYKSSMGKIVLVTLKNEQP